MSNKKEYSIEVWDLTFFRVDEDGNEELDQNGEIKIYDCYAVNTEFLADGLEFEDLTPIEEPQHRHYDAKARHNLRYYGAGKLEGVTND